MCVCVCVTLVYGFTHIHTSKASIKAAEKRNFKTIFKSYGTVISHLSIYEGH